LLARHIGICVANAVGSGVTEKNTRN
jgi:hypothetical protein